MWNYLLLVAFVQGVTEFLPISSSAHLILLPAISGQADQGLTIDVAAHLGSLFAVLAYFWRDVTKLATELVTLRWKDGLLLQRAVATVPVVIVGVLAKDLVEGELRSPWVIAVTTVVFGVVLYLVDRRPVSRALDKMPLQHAAWIGTAQVLALIPGTSRSGITMSAARALNYDRQASARFSMLLGIPTILGAALLMGRDIQAAGDWEMGGDALLVAGASFVFALIAVAGMMRWLRTASFTPFVIYRIGLGIALAAWLLVGG